MRQGSRPGSVAILCGKCAGNAGFFYAILILDSTSNWVPRETSQLELMTAPTMRESSGTPGGAFPDVLKLVG